MNRANNSSKNILIAALCGVAVLLLMVIYFSPVWWVSLKAPNYPAEAFPDGIRIHFHMNGVFNGCKKQEGRQIQEDVALDCVHEMDTINHYVGMYPIAAGAPIERAFSPYLVSLLGVMVIGFAVRKRTMRVATLAVGSVVIAGWMFLTFHTEDGLKYQSEGYLKAMVTALDQDAGDSDSGPDQLSSSEAVIERLRESLRASGVEGEAPSQSPQARGKQAYIEHLRITFEKDQERRGRDVTWDGSGSQLVVWHYEKTLGRYFNNPEEIAPMVATLKAVSSVVFWSLITAMVALVVGTWMWRPFSWLLVLVPMALPVFFLIDYAGWLWWFGHNLNEMGAFTVKAFMPTVFGQGKVAQFSTHSYPHYGFGVMLLLSLVTGLAALLRRKQPEGAS
ncbi:MAG: hypothetical protein DWQ09_04855 [Proteobacteria bacterium]|nr:MAG: hypothetical protein DWQ09_04855 [Pseudomonadota bacterium]QKK11293.1 MAG: hypothetical protein HND59_06510 [Pseudomonadota bacterium]